MFDKLEGKEKVMKNKQIIKALALGISASMVMQPVTVLAEAPEGEGVQNTNVTSEGEQAQQPDAFETASSEIRDAEDAFVGKAETVPVQDNTSADSAEDGETTGTTEGGESTGSTEGGETTGSTEDGETTGSTEDGAVTGSVEEKATPDTLTVENAKKDTEDYKNTVNSVLPADTEGLADINNELGSAITDLTNGATALDDAQKNVEAANTANNKVSTAIKNYDTNIESAESALAVGVLTEVEKEDGSKETELHQVSEYADAITDAGAATTSYGQITTDANTVKGTMESTKTDADTYANSGADADIDGTALQALQDQYNEAKGVLDDLDVKLTEAEAKYDAASKEYNDANDALTVAQTAYTNALAAYNSIEGLEAVTDEQIAAAEENLIKAQADLDAAVLTEGERKAVLKDAEGEVVGAKQELDAAKADVEEKLGAVQNRQMQEIINLQNTIENLQNTIANPSEDDNVDALKDNVDERMEELKKKIIAYYILGEENVTAVKFNEQSSYNLQVAKDALGNDIEDVNGNKCYLAGYDENKAPVFKPIPSALSVTYKTKGENGEDVSVTTFYFVEISEDGKTFNVSSHDGNATEGTKVLAAEVPAYYKNQAGEKVSAEEQAQIDALSDKAKLVSEDGKSVVAIDKSKDPIETLADAIEDAPETYEGREISKGDFVEVKGSEPVTVVTYDENGNKIVTVTKTYTQETVTEDTVLDGSETDYEYGTRQYEKTVITREFESSEEGYKNWLAAIEEHKNDDGFVASYYDYEIEYYTVKVWGKDIPYWIKGVNGAMKNVDEMTSVDQLSYQFDIVSSWFGKKPFAISYNVDTETTVQEDKNGFYETVTDKYVTKQTTTVDTYTQDTVTTYEPIYQINTNAGQAEVVSASNPATTTQSGYNTILKGSWEGARQRTREQLDGIIGAIDTEIKQVGEPITECNGNVATVTTTYTQTIVVPNSDRVLSVKDLFGVTKGYRYTYQTQTITYQQVTTYTNTGEIIGYKETPISTETKTMVKAEGEGKTTSTTVETGNQTVVSSKNFYGTKEYSHVAKQDAVEGTYYSVADATTWGTSSDENYVALYNAQVKANRKLTSAQNAYSTAVDAYEKAQTELTEARKAVATLKEAKAGKADLIDALTKENLAKKALAEAKENLQTAKTNVGNAKTALTAATTAKEAAEAAVAAAKTSEQNASISLSSAQTAKTQADARRAAEAAQNPSQDPTDQPSQNPAEGQNADRPSQNPTEGQNTDQPSQNPTEGQNTDQPSQNPTEGQNAEQPSQNPTEGQNTDQPSQNPTEGQNTDQPSQNPTEGQNTDQPSQNPTEGQNAEQPSQNPTEGQNADQPSQNPTEGQNADEPSQNPTEGQNAEQPSQNPTEGQNADQPSQNPTEGQTVDQPSQEPAQESAEEQISNESTQESTQNETPGSVQETVQNAGQNASQETAQNAAQNASQETAQNAAQNGTQETSQNASQNAGQNASQSTSQNASQEAANQAANTETATTVVNEMDQQAAAGTEVSEAGTLVNTNDSDDATTSNVISTVTQNALNAIETILSAGVGNTAAGAQVGQVLGANRPSTSSTATASAANAKKADSKTADTKTADASTTETKSSDANDGTTLVASASSDNNGSDTSANQTESQDSNKVEEKKETTTVETETNIADEETAKAATPVQQEKSFPYWILIILAAIAGVSVEEYMRKKNIKVKADSDSDRKAS